jgi:hypothetical protein
MNGIGNFWRLEKITGVIIRTRLTGGQIAARYIAFKPIKPHHCGKSCALRQVRSGRGAPARTADAAR